MIKVLEELSFQFYSSLAKRMMKEGWETNGTYWWFEDTGAMTFRDAISLHKGSRGKYGPEATPHPTKAGERE